jgi:adenylyl-sulfate reductase (glutathione)
MDESYGELAQEFSGSHVRIAKFRADIERDFSASKFGLATFPTVVLMAKGRAGYVKYPTERRDSETMGMWVRSMVGKQ